MNADVEPTKLNEQSDTDFAGWPVGDGHEQHLEDALECVNDAIRRTQTLYDYAEGGELEGGDADLAAGEAAGIRGRVVEGGETIEEAANAAPDLAALDEAVIDDCTTYYGDLREVDAVLGEAWETLNDAAGAAEAAASGGRWGRVTDGKEFESMVADARDSLWEAQARIEVLLLDHFGHGEDEFARPAEDIDWN